MELSYGRWELAGVQCEIWGGRLIKGNRISWKPPCILPHYPFPSSLQHGCDGKHSSSHPGLWDDIRMEAAGYKGKQSEGAWTPMIILPA